MANETFAQLSQFGFTPVNDAVCVGTWNNYAVELQRYSGRTYYTYLAIRIPKADKAVKKACNAAFKAAGLKRATVMGVAPNFVQAACTLEKGDAEVPCFRTFMDTLTGTLARNGIAPANTCALTGAPNPDSLCLVLNNKYMGYQPVVGAAVRQGNYDLQARVEENENNGSYASGFVGALIGALLAVAINVAAMVFTDRMYAILFALVPIFAMFGYKLFKGRTNKGSLIILLLLSLLAIPLMVYLTVTVSIVREYGVPLGDALRAAGQIVVNPEYLAEVRGTLLMMLLFMALGLLIAWRFIRGQLNSTRVQTSNLQVETMRPNPAVVQAPPVADEPEE